MRDNYDILRLWAEADFATERWREWAMKEVFADEDILRIDDADGHPLCSLALQPYTINWIGDHPTRIGYIMCAATAKAHRHEGLMAGLMRRALNEAHDRGMAMVTLIPANRPLYFFYDKLGFSTVIYEYRRRYVAGAMFTLRDDAPDVTELAAQLSDEDVQAVIDIESATSGSVIHTPKQIANFIADNRMDHGIVMVARHPDGSLQGIALAVPSADEVTVQGIIAADIHAERAMLHAIAQRHPRLSMVARCAVSASRPMEAQGMARIADADTVMRLIATARCQPTVDSKRQNTKGRRGSEQQLIVRVRDSIVPANNHTWIIADGQATIDDTPRDHYDLDVSTAVLTRILCSGTSISDIFNIPTCRPHLSLMLD